LCTTRKQDVPGKNRRRHFRRRSLMLRRKQLVVDERHRVGIGFLCSVTNLMQEVMQPPRFETSALLQNDHVSPSDPPSCSVKRTRIAEWKNRDSKIPHVVERGGKRQIASVKNSAPKLSCVRWDGLACEGWRGAEQQP